MTAPAWLSPLTDREQKILELLADGCERAEIASKLGTGWGTSVSTVKADMVRLYARLGARNAAHAVSLGYRYGLLKVGAE